MTRKTLEARGLRKVLSGEELMAGVDLDVSAGETLYQPSLRLTLLQGIPLRIKL